MTTETQKTICRSLERMAARATMIDREPATAKQCWFLAGLLLAEGHDARSIDGGNSNYILTKARASTFIDDCLRAKARREAA